MRRSWAPLALVLLAGPLYACGGGAASAGTQRNADVITLEEIQAADVATAMDVVSLLRPRWLGRSRGPRTLMDSGQDFTRVSVDGGAPQDAAYLDEIPRDVLLELRLLSAREATFLFGTGFNAGLIKVTTRK